MSEDSNHFKHVLNIGGAAIRKDTVLGFVWMISAKFSIHRHTSFQFVLDLLPFFWLQSQNQANAITPHISFRLNWTSHQIDSPAPKVCLLVHFYVLFVSTAIHYSINGNRYMPPL